MIQMESSELEQNYGVPYREKMRGRGDSSCRFDHKIGNKRVCVGNATQVGKRNSAEGVPVQRSGTTVSFETGGSSLLHTRKLAMACCGHTLLLLPGHRSRRRSTIAVAHSGKKKTSLADGAA